MKRLLLSVRSGETRLALAENGKLEDYLVEREDSEELVGRVYKGVVKNVVPAVKGRFIDLGIGRNGFLRDADCIGKPPTEGASAFIQVIKDATETKGPLLTEKISLPGRYAALMTDTDYIGISKKIRDDGKRAALRETAKAYCPAGLGLVVRTAAADASLPDIEKDIAHLAAQWETIRRREKREKAPALLYRENELAVRAVRDFLSAGIEEIVTDAEEEAARLQNLCGEAVPVRTEKGNLFKTYGLEEQIHRLFEREVPLPSGGSVIIERTEALTAIDVNSGGFHRPGIPHEEIAFLVNLEAAEEIARQIKMRGLGGMLLIDFIDMEEDSHKKAVIEKLRTETAKDRVKTVVLGMTKLGLVEMTRKRTQRRLSEIYYEPCPCCKGTGEILTAGSVVSRIYRALEGKKEKGGSPRPLVIECHPEVAEILSRPEEIFRVKSLMLRPVRVQADEEKPRDVFSILADTEYKL